MVEKTIKHATFAAESFTHFSVCDDSFSKKIPWAADKNETFRSQITFLVELIRESLNCSEVI